MAKKQEELIRLFDYDLLAILDSCRYDTFKEIYSKYFDGELLKTISPAGDTKAWLRKTFPSYYDIIYVSANPLVFRHKRWRGGEHFRLLDNVWDYGWSPEYATVLPDEVSQSVRRNFVKSPRATLIAHYLQPHEPYIGRSKLLSEIPPPLRMRLPSTVREVASSTKDIHPAVRELIEGAGRKIDRLLMRKTKLVCDMVREGSVDLDVVKEVYIDNLRLALRSIKELILRIKPFTSKIVISSDHGEIFHYNEFGHNDSYEYKDHPELYEVPWLILKKNKGKN